MNNWREKREFARLEQPVTGVTAHAGVARSLEKRKFGANLGIFHFGYLSLLDMLGSSGCKFGANLDIWSHSDLVREREKKSWHGQIFQIWEFWARVLGSIWENSEQRCALITERCRYNNKFNLNENITIIKTNYGVWGFWGFGVTLQTPLSLPRPHLITFQTPHERKNIFFYRKILFKVIVWNVKVKRAEIEVTFAGRCS